MRVENFLFSESGHPVVALAVKPLVLGIADEADEPVARTIAGEVGSGRIFVLLVKLVALGAAHVRRGDEGAAFFNRSGVLGIGVAGI